MSALTSVNIQSTDLEFVSLTSTPLVVEMQCIDDVDCGNGLTRLFQLLSNGQLRTPYRIITGEYGGRTYTNPQPIYTFPTWAIGVIIASVLLVALAVLLLCICCRRKKQRRKRRPQKSGLYVPLKEGNDTPDAGDPVIVVDGGGVSRSDVEDVDMPFEVLFSVKKSDKPDALLVNRKEVVMVKKSDWESRTEVVRATNSKGVTGIIPSTHLKQSKKKK